KGATAEPLVSTISPPNSAMTRRIGSSQNFLRTRMNCQSSPTNVIGTSSELLFQAVGGRTGRLACDPVADGARVSARRNGRAAERAHEQTRWRDHAIEDDRQHDRADEAKQQQPKRHPGTIEGCEHTWAEPGDQREHRRSGQQPRPPGLAGPELE